MPKTSGGSSYSFIHIALLLLITLLARPALAYNDSYQLSGPDAPSREGYFTLSITPAPQQQLVLQQSQSATFDTIDAEFRWFGDFEQITLTGFTDGEYFFRLQPAADAAEAPSNVVKVTVNHYPRWQAYSLFFIGLALFIVLVASLLILRRRV